MHTLMKMKNFSAFFRQREPLLNWPSDYGMVCFYSVSIPLSPFLPSIFGHTYPAPCEVLCTLQAYTIVSGMWPCYIYAFDCFTTIFRVCKNYVFWKCDSSTLQLFPKTSRLIILSLPAPNFDLLLFLDSSCLKFCKRNSFRSWFTALNGRILSCWSHRRDLGLGDWSEPKTESL
jgi:hypothetical protein